MAADDTEPKAQLKGEGEEPEDDTEGHSMLQNMGLSRELAQARERDVQQSLRRHDLENQARAHKKDHR
jgi:hypothetical protein